MATQASSAAEVFRRFGLEPVGFLRAMAVPQRGDGGGPGKKLRESFEILGGLYVAFAEFLHWRADLLGVDYLLALREIRHEIPPVPRETLEALLRKELGIEAEDLVRDMEQEPAWSTRSRTAYLSRYKGSIVVVQVARDPVPEADIDAFAAGLRFLGSPDVLSVTTPAILTEFRQWLRQAEACDTERSYLQVLAKHRGQLLVDYPEPIAEISTDRVLCWPWVDGEPVSDLLKGGSIDAATQVAVAVLEQYCSLSIIDAELQLDSMVMRPDGRLAVRRFNRPITVPLAVVNTGMKYVAAVLEGNASKAAQSLILLAVGKSSPGLQTSLLELMSAIEPELKVGFWFPKSAEAFESNWRALAKLQVERPLYLNCFHRNLMAVGYWTAEAIEAGGSQADPIADAHWPVVARVLKFNATQLIDPNVMAEWSVGLGLLGFGAMREANRLAEEVRDDNLTMEVEVGQAPRPAREGRKNSGIWLVIVALLAALLATMRWGSALSTTGQGWIAGLAFAALLGLYWAVTKLD
jgi:hypothetical protein